MVGTLLRHSLALILTLCATAAVPAHAQNHSELAQEAALRADNQDRMLISTLSFAVLGANLELALTESMQPLERAIRSYKDWERISTVLDCNAPSFFASPAMREANCLYAQNSEETGWLLLRTQLIDVTDEERVASKHSPHELFWMAIRNFSIDAVTQGKEAAIYKDAFREMELRVRAAAKTYPSALNPVEFANDWDRVRRAAQKKCDSRLGIERSECMHRETWPTVYSDFIKRKNTVVDIFHDEIVGNLAHYHRDLQLDALSVCELTPTSLDFPEEDDTTRIRVEVHVPLKNESLRLATARLLEEAGICHKIQIQNKTPH